MLGPVATAEDAQNMRLEEVSDLIKADMRSVDEDQLDTGPITVVPYDKLEFTGSRDAGAICWNPGSATPRMSANTSTSTPTLRSERGWPRCSRAATRM